MKPTAPLLSRRLRSKNSPLWRLLLCATLLLSASSLQAQTYVKLNSLYAAFGVINPAVEFTVSKHSTIQAELILSPWSAIRYEGVNRPMLGAILLNEYRYYFKEHNRGWYVAGNVGISVFNWTKPTFKDGLGFKNTSGKGYGLMAGVTAGYEWKLSEKWMLDAYAGIGHMNSHYNAYALVDGVVEDGITYNAGEIIMTPSRDTQPNPLDPFNGSGEWIPYKIGVSFSLLICDPHKNRNKRNPAE